MDSSFASYLLPWAASNKKGLLLRVKFADRWLTFNSFANHLSSYVQKHTGGTLAYRKEYNHKEGEYVETSPCPMTSPISDVLQKSFCVDPTTVKLEDFQVVELLHEKDARDPYGYTPKYAEGAVVPIDWSKPWVVPGQTGSVLEELVGGDRKKVPIVIKKAMQMLPWTPYAKMTRRGSYRPSSSIQLKTNQKPFSPRCVIMNSGAIYDYNDEKVVAASLDDWLREYLDLPPTEEIPWTAYLNHILIQHISVGTVLAYKPIESTDMTEMENKMYWKSVGAKIRAAMPFLNATAYERRYFRTGTLVLMAFNKITNQMESYELLDYGFRRTFSEKPKQDFTYGTPEYEAQQKEVAEWRRHLALETVKELAASSPDRLWFAQVIRKYGGSQIESIDLQKYL
jgi:hypothetical protein